MTTSEAKTYLHKIVAGHYSVDRLIGEGSFAWVYHAVSRQMGLEVAIKVLHSTEPTAAMRFAREIEVLKALPKNANVVGLVDHGQTHDCRPFQVIEYVDGITLKDGIRLCKSLIPRQAVSFMIELCQAFVELHQLGVAHRDVKPENILLARQGGIKLIDFGLIRDAQGLLQLLEREDPLDTRHLFSQELDRWTVAGTPEYMAPEQFSDAKMDDLAKARTDTWSDVFSLGVIFYQLLSGKKPYPMRPVTNKGYHREILRYMRWRMSLTDEDYPVCPGIDEALDSVLRKMLRQDPRQRQPEARALMVDLVRYKKTGDGVPLDDAEHTQMLHMDRVRLGRPMKDRTVDISSPAERVQTAPTRTKSDAITTPGPPAPPSPDPLQSDPEERGSEASTLDSPHEGDQYYNVDDFDDEDEETHLDASPEVDAIVAEVRAPKGSTEIFFSSLASTTKREPLEPQFAAPPSNGFPDQHVHSSPSSDVITQPGQPTPSSNLSTPQVQPPSLEHQSMRVERPPSNGRLDVVSHRPPGARRQDTTTQRQSSDEHHAVVSHRPPNTLKQNRTALGQSSDGHQDTVVQQPQAEASHSGSSLSALGPEQVAVDEEMGDMGSLDISIEANDSVIITEDFQLEPEEHSDLGSEPGPEEAAVGEQADVFKVPEPPRAPIRRPQLPPWIDEPDWDEHAPTNVHNPQDVDAVLEAVRKRRKKE